MNKQKPKYSTAKCVAFMLKTAWDGAKSVIFLCLAGAVATAALTVAQMLVAPIILNEVEIGASIYELLLTIAVCTLTLMLIMGIKYYIVEDNTTFGRIDVRIKIIKMYSLKHQTTSYPNLMDERFNNLYTKSSEACAGNSQPGEHVWTTMTDIVSNILGFAVYLVLLSGLGPMLAAVVIVTTVLGYIVRNRINEWEYRHRDEGARLTKRLFYMRNVGTGRKYAKEIRIFGLSEWIDDVWNSCYRLYESFLKKREGVLVWAGVADLVITLLRNGIAYAYLINLALSNGMSASEFLLYFNAASGFSQWVAGILDKFTELHKECIDISSILEFLDYPEPFNFGEGAYLNKNVEGYEIKLEDVSYRYPGADKDTISHMNLTIHAGEKLAIVGLNGAGKTTLVKLACGFLDPTHGRVLLNGEDIKKFNRREYYELFSAVFQDFSVLDVTVAENVAQSVGNIDTEKVWDCLDKAGLTEDIKRLPKGLDTHIGRQVYEDGVELSGGQTQRLMLARALYKDGPILTLDEPTAALDPLAENDIYMRYDEMTSGKTSIFISHRLASTRFCDRILFLKDGNIAEEGTHGQLLRHRGGYYELFEIQSKYYKNEGGENDV